MITDERQTPRTCHEVTPLLPELSLGVLGGRGREQVLRHLSGCPVCSLELEQLSTVADGLLTLAPRCEPPAGFDLELSRRLRAEEQRHDPAAPPGGRRRHRHHQSVVARRLFRSRSASAVAAVLLAALLAFGSGWLLRSHRPPPPDYPGTTVSSPAASATLMSGNHPVGRLLLFAGRPDWLMVSVHHMAGEPTVECTVTTTGGRTMTMGTFSLSGGSGTWSAPLEVAPTAVATATLLDHHGKVVATALVRRPAP